MGRSKIDHAEPTFDGADGLTDIRLSVELWGKTSVCRELAAMPENEETEDLGMTELVLTQDLPARLAEERIKHLA